VPRVVPETEKLQRHRAFWSRAETDRPLLGATIATFPSVSAVTAHGILSPADLDVATNVRELEAEWDAWRDCSGDAVWVANPLWAFPWHLALAGCPIQRDDENLWGLPFLESWEDLERIRFDPANLWFRKLAEFVQALVTSSAGRYPVGAGQLMLGPVDMMMQSRGQERLAVDLYDNPEQVRALATKCTQLVIDATRAQQAITPLHQGGYAGTIRYVWAPGPLVESAEDISFMMSPSLHRKYVAPMHRALAREFSHTVIHLHSAQLHTVSSLLEVEEVAAVQITPDFGEDMLKYLPVMASILERKPLILHGVIPVDAVRELMRQLPHRGLCIFVRCDTPEDGARTLDALN
jgi:hypothetical protein